MCEKVPKTEWPASRHRIGSAFASWERITEDFRSENAHRQDFCIASHRHIVFSTHRRSHRIAPRIARYGPLRPKSVKKCRDDFAVWLLPFSSSLNKSAVSGPINLVFRRANSMETQNWPKRDFLTLKVTQKRLLGLKRSPFGHYRVSLQKRGRRGKKSLFSLFQEFHKNKGIKSIKLNFLWPKMAG